MNMTFKGVISFPLRPAKTSQGVSSTTRKLFFLFLIVIFDSQNLLRHITQYASSFKMRLCKPFLCQLIQKILLFVHLRDYFEKRNAYNARKADLRLGGS